MQKAKTLFLLLILLPAGVVGQASVNSPYSAFGIGEFDNGSQTTFRSMGGAKIAFQDSTYLNISNPASYAFIGEHKPIFNVDMNVKLGRAFTNNDEKSIRSSSFNNACLGIPISRRWGAVLGINPFSQVGYNIRLNEPFMDGDTIQYRYQGEGGANRLLVGFGYSPIRNKKRALALGVNFSYLFGSAERIRTAIMPTRSSFLNGKINNSLRFRDLFFEAGVTYREQLNPFQSLTLSAVYSRQNEVNAFNDVYAYSFRYVGTSVVNETVYDTIEFNDDIQGSVTMPQRITLGAMYEIKPDNEKRNKRGKERSFYRLLINGEAEIQDWSNYSENFQNSTTTFNLNNSLRTSLGIQFTPNDGSAGKKPTQSYFGFLNYRLGVRYLKTKLNLNNQDIEDFGISFGLGLPIGSSTSGATLNFGTEFRRRGTTNNNLIQEDYVNFYFGVSLIPGRYESWFIKRKFD